MFSDQYSILHWHLCILSRSPGSNARPGRFSQMICYLRTVPPSREQARRISLFLDSLMEQSIKSHAQVVILFGSAPFTVGTSATMGSNGKVSILLTGRYSSCMARLQHAVMM
jgi:hypothetical protein